MEVAHQLLAHAGRALGVEPVPACQAMASSPKIIVFDDDPTVADRSGLSFAVGLQHGKPAGGFGRPLTSAVLLTNSRALEPEQVRQQLTLLCQRLKPLLSQLIQPWLVVSRGDSTCAATSC